MLLDHTNPDSIERNAIRVKTVLRILSKDIGGPLDVRLVANADGELWFATGDVQYDTQHGAACEAIELNPNADDNTLTELSRELVNGVADQLAEQTAE
jgi:hypothetical protein